MYENSGKTGKSSRTYEMIVIYVSSEFKTNIKKSKVRNLSMHSFSTKKVTPVLTKKTSCWLKKSCISLGLGIT